MKADSFKFLRAALATLSICISTQAGFTNTFDTAGSLSPTVFQNAGWSAGPSGWAGNPGTLQATDTNGGWTEGDGGGPKFDFHGGTAHLADIQALVGTSNGRVRCNVIVDGSSFSADTASTFWTIYVAGNSETGSWNPNGPCFNGDHTLGDATLFHTNIDFTFAQLGWTHASDTWFQLFFGANSLAGQPVKYYIDNLTVYEGSAVVPSSIAITSLDYSAITGFTVSGTGSPEGAAYRCLSSANATAPLGTWTQVGSGVIVGGAFTISDPSATSTSPKFYRMATP